MAGRHSSKFAAGGVRAIVCAELSLSLITSSIVRRCVPLVRWTPVAALSRGMATWKRLVPRAIQGGRSMSIWISCRTIFGLSTNVSVSIGARLASGASACTPIGALSLAWVAFSRLCSPCCFQANWTTCFWMLGSGAKCGTEQKRRGQRSQPQLLTKCWTMRLRTWFPLAWFGTRH